MKHFNIKKLNKTVLTVVMLYFSINAMSQTEIRITTEELLVLHNTSWTGELIYVNYSDGKEVTLQTKMQIEIKNDKIIMHTQYDNEPSANSKSTIKLKNNGTHFGKEKIVKKDISKSGTVTLKTKFEGKDDNKPATIMKTYVYDGNHFSVTKEVRFKGSTESLVRNRYTYSKL
ncbi:hypothetical protein [uncultured Psychroserpens sp.]|uniref:hypothetical protein n=1 Tax=uncultured Psychroserpens sp. TaxID=255436 RepID=UPI0026179A69|nr:hypothetical protein [uncultured Psychroserpens sp.]